MLGGISGIGGAGYGVGGYGNGDYNSRLNPFPQDPGAEGEDGRQGARLIDGEDPKARNGVVLNEGESTKKQAGRKSSPAECQTCKNRKYQDGSNEMDVSFKAPGHIDPGNAASVVMGHEQQHVANAYQKAGANNGRVVQASVRLKTAVCPECGRTYISGGETRTQIRYYNEDNPYQKDMKESDADNKYRGANVDEAA